MTQCLQCGLPKESYTHFSSLGADQASLTVVCICNESLFTVGLRAFWDVGRGIDELVAYSGVQVGIFYDLGLGTYGSQTNMGSED